MSTHSAQAIGGLVIKMNSHRKSKDIVVFILLQFAALVLFSSTQLFATETKLIDPTKPPVSARTIQRKKIKHFNLSEIKITKKNRQAVINGRRLNRGESIGGYQLKKIQVGYVILANAQNSIRVNLIKNPIIRKKL